ncbi:hypothetical protein ESCO_004678 [Escovopsis weberi]|uniref:Uncharacterized protein n=1 Tax=Escovopsis weberi TaxID=150374 RepID=A0A0M8MY93_ESCWE|nr:hypothetical protein ESCO_004678 [Escovopsis weberi]
MVSIQSNMQVQDELAALFTRNLTFNPELRPDVPQQLSSPEEVMSEAHPSQPISYSISQHYNHSTTVTMPANNEFQRASSEPFRSETNSSEVLLRIHGIDPATLTPSQLQLFRVADTPQRRRLVELWSICPPSSGGEIPALAWSSTSVEQEEQLARLRYERQQQSQVMSLDGTMVQTSDSRWVQNDAQVSPTESEPYMLSGYEELMQRERQKQAVESTIPRSVYNHYTPATDPVYMGADYSRQMHMAQQYGAFEQSREVDAMDM